MVDAIDLFGGTWPPSPSSEACSRVARAFAPGGLGLIFVRGAAMAERETVSARATDPGSSTESCPACAQARLLALSFELGSLDPIARGAILASAGVGRDGPRTATHALSWDDETWCARAVHANAPHCTGECVSGATGGGAGRIRELMDDVGGSLARICAGIAAAADVWLDGSRLGTSSTLPPSALFKSLVSARAAKARLVMYAAIGGGGASGPTVGPATLDEKRPLWQPWHYDFGLFTALTRPAYSRGVRGCEAPQGAGLIVAGHDRICVPPFDCIAVQAGEAAQLLSWGRLVATPHAVRSPALAAGADVSRAVLAVFCLPPWGLRLPDGGAAVRAATLATSEEASRSLPTDAGVPPLSARWAGGDGDDAQTFAQFAKATTAAYYGVGGAQRDVKRT